jgi:hypothetical protein
VQSVGSLESARHTSLLGDHSEREPPDPIPNSEVKPFSADDSVALCHVKVGNRQALIPKTQAKKAWVFFCPEMGKKHQEAVRAREDCIPSPSASAENFGSGVMRKEDI